jgi:hypothetical protein
MNANSTKGKKKPKNIHITIVIDPTKLMQPYKTTSSAHTLPHIEQAQHKKIKHDNVGPTSNTSLQSSIPLKPASSPRLIMVNKFSAVISQHTSLLTNHGINIDMSLTQISDLNFCHMICQSIIYRYFAAANFTTRSIMESTTRNLCHFVALC